MKTVKSSTKSLSLQPCPPRHWSSERGTRNCADEVTRMPERTPFPTGSIGASSFGRMNDSPCTCLAVLRSGYQAPARIIAAIGSSSFSSCREDGRCIAQITIVRSTESRRLSSCPLEELARIYVASAGKLNTHYTYALQTGYSSSFLITWESSKSKNRTRR